MKKKIKKNDKISNWLMIQSLVTVVASVMTFALIQFCDNMFFTHSPNYNPIDALGMILPMTVVVGFISTVLSRYSSKYLSKLVNALEEVANGNFDVRLDESMSDSIIDVYSNFNKMVDELNGIQTLKQDFINNFSHEFKTPITSINGFANLLLESNISDEEKNQYLQIIAKESARLSVLADSTLLMSKLDSQMIVLEKNNYSLDEQIRQCSILLSNDWSKKNIDFSVELEPVIYYGNYSIMQHIWINLLSNAIKFTPKNGEITITMVSSKKDIIISFTDTGIGMNEETLNNIFDKYYQSDSSRTLKGLGLGLPIAKRIIELCEGTIEVKSIVNEGSVFTVILPNSNHK